MAKEIKLFFTALMFFTRIPCPAWVGYSKELLNNSLKYFTVIGWIVGGFSVLICWLSLFIFPLSISILISMSASILITGALHEDGFTDVCDSFGGGWGKEQILTIMKDSRIGAYGVIGIILILSFKFAALYEIAKYSSSVLLFSILNAHASGRFMALTVIQTSNYVQDLDKSKSKPMGNAKLNNGKIFFSFFTALMPMVCFVNNWYLMFAMPICYIPKLYLENYFKKHIGGYTGDCIGAVQQVCEVSFYLSVLALWKFIY